MAGVNGSINRNANLVGVLTGLSRVFGLIREMLTSRLIGSGLEQSAFVFAFTVPNLFRKLFGEGALSSAFIPVFKDELENGGRERAESMARAVSSMVALLLSLICILGILGICCALPCSEGGGRVGAVLRLMRIMLPYAVLICVAAFAGGILNSFGKFGKAAFAPALLNLVWIATLCGLFFFPALSKYERVRIVAWSVLISGVMQLAYLVHAVHGCGMRLRPTFSGWRAENVRLVWRNTFVGAVGMGAGQINLLLDNFLAMWAAPWAPAAISYAERVVYLPLGVVATAFATVLLPSFSSHFAKGDHDGASATLLESAGDVLLFMMPAALGLVVLAPDITSVIYEGGSFKPEDAVRVSRALMCYAPGLLVFSANKILTPWFYAKKDVKTPLRVGLWMVGANAFLNILLVITLPYEWKHAGIAGSTVVCSAVSCLVLAYKTRDNEGKRVRFGALAVPAFKYLLSSLLMCAAVLIFLRIAQPHVVAGGGLYIAAVGAAVVVGAAVYGVAVYGLCPEAMRRALGRKGK